MSSTNTRTVVLHRLVRQRKLAQIVTDHLSLDFNVVEVATVVHTNNRTNHLRNHDHVAEVSLHRVRTLVLGSLSLLSLNNVNYNTHSLAQSLDQRLGLSLQTAAESATRASLLSHAFPSPYIDQLHQVLRRHIQQFVQIHSTVRELLERSLLLLLSVHLNVVEVATVVHTNNRTNHLGNHDHVTQVSLHRVRTLVLGSLSLLYLNTGNYNTHSLTQSLDQRLRLSLQTTTESATSTSLHIHQYSLNNKPLINTYINQFHQILRRHIQQLVQIHSTVCELLERSLLLLLSVHFNILILTHCYLPFTHNTSSQPHYTHKHATTIRNHAVSIILLHTIANTLTSSLMMANGNDS